MSAAAIAQTGDRVLSMENRTRNQAIFTIISAGKQEVLAVGPLAHREMRLVAGGSYAVRVDLKDAGTGKTVFETSLPVRMSCSEQQFLVVTLTATATSHALRDAGCMQAKF